MQNGDNETAGASYCCKCGYDLRGQVALYRCPECGRGFDPGDATTFRTRPMRGAGWRWARRGGIPALVVACLLGMAWGWLYWGWHDEQEALAKMHMYKPRSEPLGGERLRGYLGWGGWVLDRVRYVAGETSLSLTVRFPQATDADLLHLSKLKWLTELDLRRTHVTDAGLVHLKKLKGLQNLVLFETGVTRVGVEELRASLPQTQIDWQ